MMAGLSGVSRAKRESQPAAVSPFQRPRSSMRPACGGRECDGFAQMLGLGARCKTLLGAHVTLFPIALARAEAENALIMAGTKAAMLHDDADGACLLEGQPQACSDLRIRHAEIGTVAVA